MSGPSLAAAERPAGAAAAAPAGPRKPGPVAAAPDDHRRPRWAWWTDVLVWAVAVVAIVATDADREAQRIDLTVWWMAPFYSGGGYSSEAIAYVLPLSQRTDVKIDQHGDAIDPAFVYGLPPHERAQLDALFVKRRSPGNSVVICHSEPGAWYPPLYRTSWCPPSPNSAYVVGRTMFETDRLTQGHVERCNAMDEVWVPSKFHVETFSRSGVQPEKLVVVPEPVDVDTFNPTRARPVVLPPAPAAGVADEHGTYSPTDRDGIDEGLFRFLSVFKWEERKGWQVLLRAYFSEFTAADPVVLYLKTNAYHSNADFRGQILALTAELGPAPAAGLARVVIMDRPIPAGELPGLYAAANAFVLPTRGEGWGRPHVEAMAMGLPIIATNWSGSTEFLRDSNSYPLPIDGLIEIPAGPFRGHRWAEPSLAALRQLMRHVVEHPDEARAKGRQARADMVRYYRPAVVTELVLRELRRIQATVHARRQRAADL